MTSHSFFYFLEHPYWLGIIDVVTGDWRWIYDQTTLNYKFWISGRPFPTSNGNSKIYNCVIMYNGQSGKWLDYPCNYAHAYICESNFCKFIILFRR